MNPYSPRVRLSLAEVLHNVNDLQSRSPVVETPLRGGFGSPPPGAGGYHPGNLRFSSPGLSPAYPPSGGPATPKKQQSPYRPANPKSPLNIQHLDLKPSSLPTPVHRVELKGERAAPQHVGLKASELTSSSAAPASPLATASTIATTIAATPHKGWPARFRRELELLKSAVEQGASSQKEALGALTVEKQMVAALESEKRQIEHDLTAKLTTLEDSKAQLESRAKATDERLESLRTDLAAAQQTQKEKIDVDSAVEEQLKMLEESKTALEARASDAGKEIVSLRGHLTQAKSELEQASLQLHDAATRLEKEEARCVALEHSLASSNVQRASLAGRVEALEESATRQRTILEAVSSERDKATASLASTQQVFSAAEVQRKTLERNLVSATKERETVVQQLRDSEKTARKAREEGSALVGEWQTRHEELSRERQELFKRAETLDRDVKKLSSRLKTAEVARDKAAKQVAGAEANAKELEHARAELQSQLTLAAEEKRALGIQCEELGGMLKRAQGAVSEHEKANTQLCSRLTDLEGTLSGVRTENVQFKTENTQFQDKVSGMECEATKYQKEVTALSAHNERLQGENARLTAARSMAQGEVAETSGKLRLAAARHQEVALAAQRAIEVRDALEMQFHATTKQVASLEGELAQQRNLRTQDASATTTQVASLEGELAQERNLRTKVASDMTTQVAGLEGELAKERNLRTQTASDMTNQLEALGEVKGALATKLALADRSAKAMEIERATLEEERDCLQAMLGEITTHRDTLDEKLLVADAAIQDGQVRELKLQAALDEECSRGKMMASQHQASLKTCVDLRDQIASRDCNIASLQQELSGVERQRDEDVAAERAATEALRARMSAMETSRTKLSSQLASSRAACDEKSAALDAMRHKVAALQQVRSALHRQAEQVLREVATLKGKLHEAVSEAQANEQKGQIAVLEQVSQTLSARLEHADTEVRTLGGSLHKEEEAHALTRRELSEARERAEASLKEVEGEYAKCQEDIRALSNRTQQLLAVRAALRGKNEELTEKLQVACAERESLQCQMEAERSEASAREVQLADELLSSQNLTNHQWDLLEAARLQARKAGDHMQALREAFETERSRILPSLREEVTQAVEEKERLELHVLALDRHRAALEGQYQREIASLKSSTNFDREQLGRLRGNMMTIPSIFGSSMDI